MIEKKRIVAWILTIMMVFQMMPTSALGQVDLSVWSVAGRSNVAEGAQYYEVNFLVNDESVKTVATQYIEVGADAALVLPQEPTREGCKFDAW